MGCGGRGRDRWILLHRVSFVQLVLAGEQLMRHLVAIRCIGGRTSRLLDRGASKILSCRRYALRAASFSFLANVPKGKVENSHSCCLSCCLNSARMSFLKK